MKTLAIAKPNKRYRWYSSLRQVTLEARLCNNKVHYYELCNGTVNRISEELVRSMFPTGCLIKERPFLVRENHDFYVVLNRHRVNYKPLYKQLKHA
jgi:hypothetical protein